MLLSALAESSGRLPGVPPIGYDGASIQWVVEVDAPAKRVSILGPFAKGVLTKDVPMRGDRAGTVTEENLKPALFVDRASYVFGLSDKGEIDTTAPEHRGFLGLLEKAALEIPDQEASEILQFLQNRWPAASVSSESGSSESENLQGLRDRVRKDVKPRDLVALRSGGEVFPFERPRARSFWASYLEQRCSEGTAFCSICGEEKGKVRILPWQIAFFGYSCPISSFNNPAFDSLGKKQTSNSPMCFGCASRASQALQHLVQSARHSAVLARDESKGGGKAPLRNQLAVFWLKDEVPQAAVLGGRTIDLSILRAPLDPDAALAPPPAEVGQMKSLLSIPWGAERSALRLDDSFYLAVLSPNKSRLVLREWVEESLGAVVEKLSAFVDAASIIDSDGAEVVFPTIPRVLEALRPWKSRSARVDTNLVRGLLRTAYRGLLPPHGLLEQAVQRFRVQDRPQDRKEETVMAERRTVLAAAMKLVITYGNEEAIALQRLDASGRNSAYLSGQLLAILEEAQMRAARWNINSTLVDRYYGAASTAPGSVLGQLLNQSTKSHMPKVRKEGMGYGALEELLENALGRIDDRGGFPSTLTLRQQAEFALGFYHQRGAFRAGRPGKKGGPENQPQSDAQQQGESK